MRVEIWDRGDGCGSVRARRGSHGAVREFRLALRGKREQMRVAVYGGQFASGEVVRRGMRDRCQAGSS